MVHLLTDDGCSLQEMHGEKSGSDRNHPSWTWRSLSGIQIVLVHISTSFSVYTEGVNLRHSSSSDTILLF